MPDTGHGALSGPCSGLCGAAGHLVTIRFQSPLNFSRRILGCLRHFQDCCRHDLVQLFRLVLVEAGALELVHVLADQGQLIGKYLERILAHV
jgi:hypothetical protein